MAAKEETSSLEDILNKNLPEKELQEVKRILYGRPLEWVNISSKIKSYFNIK